MEYALSYKMTSDAQSVQCDYKMNVDSSADDVLLGVETINIDTNSLSGCGLKKENTNNRKY